MLRYVLLALLSRTRRHGYELKAAFEGLLGGTWPLNIGQVYTALGKLEDEGLVEWQAEPQPNVPDRKVYTLTERGEKELARWLDEAVPAPIRLRDEGFLKVVLHDTAGLGDPTAVIAQQRADHLDAVAALSRLRTDHGDDATALLLDGLLLRLEADLKWLDLCEQHWARRKGTRR